VDKLLDDLTAKVGLDRGTAEKVVQFLILQRMFFLASP